MPEGTVYVLEHNGTHYAKSPKLEGIREAMLDLTERGKITDGNKNEWSIFAMDTPLFEHRPLNQKEIETFLPITGPSFRRYRHG